MGSVRNNPSASNRVRIAFDDAAISFNVAIDTTLGEIALILERTLRPLYGQPVSVQMTLGFPRHERGATPVTSYDQKNPALNERPGWNAPASRPSPASPL